MTSTIEFFGSLGVLASQSMNAFTIPSILKISRAKSTLSFPSFPLMIALTNAIHNIAYAIVSFNRFVILSSSITFLFNLCFLVAHFQYSLNRRKMIQEFFMYPILSIVISGCGAQYFSSHCMSTDLECLQTSRLWFGTVSTVISCLCYCGQLSTFRSIIKMKNAASISPWMTAGVAFRAIVWNVYAWLVGDWFNFTSSSVGIVSAITQVILLIKFSTTKLESKQK